ncbi:thiol protease/hemagglutinin PrtT [Coprobacter tertius]|uniref:Thiol protease/hemagglutinin PrtT n=1 Tax=Coprobacter tertius TaxID=2944915 RepID=A0ABT1MDI7_9BACT|nr:thiol protease/hemagglutinin PrtT [Coprobacter tertius]MCP9610690.1 thiol protease/hemagglutinin PrtT [Coprobacter tertius]
MKKITLAIALLFLVIIMAEAKQISPETALETAKNFFSVNYPKTRSHTTNLKLIYTGKMSENNVTRSDNSIENYYYVFGNENDAPGFVMIAADDRIQPILGYSFDNRFITENMPQNIRFWLDAYNKSIAQIITSGNYKRTERELKSTSVVGPLLGETQWNQLDPYYNDCPTIRDTHCPTGCVATAMAQIMYYHKWPLTGKGSHKYVSETEKFNLSATFEGTRYDWENMTPRYNDKSSDIEKAAVAQLMFHCGVSCDMDYTYQSSGAMDNTAAHALYTYFGYDKGLRVVFADYYTTENWSRLLKSELDAQRPIMYGGSNNRNEGHEFVCDGYDNNGLFHINWGWGGYQDGYFDITILDPDGVGTGGGSGDGGFSINASAIIGIQPDKGSALYDPAASLYIENLYTSATHTGRNVKLPVRFSIFNMGTETFSGQVGLSLQDINSGNNIILDKIDFTGQYELDVFYESSPNFNIAIPSTVANGTYRLQVAAKSTNGNTWQYPKAILGDTQALILEINSSGIDISESDLSSIEKSVADNNGFTLYPNPADDRFYIKGDKPLSKIVISDLSGRIYYVNEIPGDLSGGITISQLPSGIYTVTLYSEGKYKILKLIKR